MYTSHTLYTQIMEESFALHNVCSARQCDVIIDTVCSLISVHVCLIQTTHLCIRARVVCPQADTGWWKPTALQASTQLPHGAMMSREPYCPALQEHLNRALAVAPPVPEAASRALAQAVPPFEKMDALAPPP